jgi:hypothetical protein
VVGASVPVFVSGTSVFVSGTVGVVGASTCGPGSWMSSTVVPGGTSTVTGTTSPEGSWT